MANVFKYQFQKEIVQSVDLQLLWNKETKEEKEIKHQIKSAKNLNPSENKSGNFPINITIKSDSFYSKDNHNKKDLITYSSIVHPDSENRLMTNQVLLNDSRKLPQLKHL